MLYEHTNSTDTKYGLHERYGIITDDTKFLKGLTHKEKEEVISIWFKEQYPKTFWMWFHLGITGEENVYSIQYGWDSGD